MDRSGFDEMRGLIAGASVAIAISAISELGIPDRLAAEPQTADQLAAATGTNVDFLRRTLHYLAGNGVFDEMGGDRFALNDRSRWLLSGVPASLRPRAVFFGSQLSWMAWGSFLASLRSGASGVAVAFGQTLFDYLTTHPGAGAAFHVFMAEQTAALVGPILDAYPLDGVQRLVDVGGGRGAFVAGALKRYPALHGVVFDLPSVVAGAQRVLDDAEVSDRCEVVSGSFFDLVPTGADLYHLKFILHDWPDEKCIQILANCRKAMPPGARLIVVEYLVPNEAGPSFARFMDMTMLVMTPGGRERTRPEFTRLLSTAGFEVVRVVPTAIDLSVVECTAGVSG